MCHPKVADTSKASGFDMALGADKQLAMPLAEHVVPRGKVSGPEQMVEALIQNRPMLVNIAAAIMGCRSRAEDVVQDVFIKVAEQKMVDTVQQPIAYLVRMVRNLAIDHYRRQSFERCHYEDECQGMQVAAAGGGPEAKVIHRDLIDRVCSALSELPLRTQTAFEMVRLGDMTLKEAASNLQVSQTLVHFMVKDATTYCLDYIDENQAVA